MKVECAKQKGHKDPALKKTRQAFIVFVGFHSDILPQAEYSDFYNHKTIMDI